MARLGLGGLWLSIFARVLLEGVVNRLQPAWPAGLPPGLAGNWLSTGDGGLTGFGLMGISLLGAGAASPAGALGAMATSDICASMATCCDMMSAGSPPPVSLVRETENLP